MGRLIKIAGGTAKTAVAAASLLTARYYLGRGRANEVWNTSNFMELNRLGSVDRLSVLPLVESFAVGDGLSVEPGVSYLVRAGNTTILFDFGYNMKGENPSPLLRNMESLGVGLGEIDKLFISHAHSDHIGGMSHQFGRTFALTAAPLDLGDVPVYTPVPLSCPTTRMVHVDDPQYVAKGVASTGRIPRQLFFLGWTQEQAMVVNVEDKGLVIISGCGHPTLERIVARVEMLFKIPVYGFIGGLHLPVTGSREKVLGLPVQKFIGTGLPPWRRIGHKDVNDAIDLLRQKGVQMVAVSAHDSCDWSLEQFRNAFGPAYRELEVGREITL